MNINKSWLKIIKKNKWMNDIFKKLKKDEIYDCFYKSLSFGTAGVRGIIGVGPNRLNDYTISRINIGFAKYLKKKYFFKKKISIVIAYDNRYKSFEFAKISAMIMKNFNFNVYLFKKPTATPILSFAIRFLKAQAGIVITASHNPKEYNGYKAYDNIGSQLNDKKIKKVSKNIQDIKNETKIKIIKFNKNFVNIIDKKIIIEYKKKLKTILLNSNEKKKIKIILTTQHGTSYPFIYNFLRSLGYNITVVKEQISYDPNFSNTKSPNPENIKSFELALKYANKNKADLILNCDPDADRIAIAVKHKKKYYFLTGDQLGSLLQEYIYSIKYKNNILVNKQKNKYILFTSHVTSDLGKKVALYYNINIMKSFTGFKHVAEMIETSKKNNNNFAFAYEESCGFLISDFTRDKDALQTCLIASEACNHYFLKKKTFIDILNFLYKRHGYYYDKTKTITLMGEKGQKKINNILNIIRKKKHNFISDYKVKKYLDFYKKKKFSKNKFDISNLSSNVIKIFFVDKSWVAIRPSGTEPKCKFYYCMVDKKSYKNAYIKYKKIKNHLEKIINYKKG